MTSLKVPPMHSAAYLAAARIHAAGPLSRTALFATVSFGLNSTTKREHLNRVIESGWLVEFVDKIDLSPSAKRYFDALTPEPETAKGEPVPSRTSNAMTSPPLRKSLIPSSKGFRDDIPEYSQRAGDFLHRTVG